MNLKSKDSVVCYFAPQKDKCTQQGRTVCEGILNDVSEQ